MNPWSMPPQLAETLQQSSDNLEKYHSCTKMCGFFFLFSYLCYRFWGRFQNTASHVSYFGTQDII